MNLNESSQEIIAPVSARNYQVITRLDESLPLETEDWFCVERIIMRLTEFAPREILVELTTAIVSFTDDQARRAYMLGQEDVVDEMRVKAA
ncbi:MAG: hypothetical protein HY711_02930 [Candidatus Melainabacteria bacterium]|nr:hypothetical protein [Candidatus Melainabacteria bacterium]